MIKLSLMGEVWTVRVEKTSIAQSGTDLDTLLMAACAELEALIGGLERLPADERRSRRLEDLRNTKNAVLNILP